MPSVFQLEFRSIEYYDISIVKILRPEVDSLTLNFSEEIRKRNQKIIGTVMTKTNDPWDRYGLYDLKRQKQILPPSYLQVGSVGCFIFNEKFLEIQDPDTYNYGIITPSGEEMFPCQFSEINHISNNGLAVVTTKNGKTFVNANEGLIFPVKSGYYHGFSFREGLLSICHNNKIGYINQYGQVVIEPTFDRIRNDLFIGFSNGYSWEKKNGKWGIIDVKGNVTCDFRFDAHGSMFDINKISTMVIDDKLYFVSPDGHMEYRDAMNGYYGGESVYIVKKETGWGFQNIKGDSLYFDAVFDDIIGFDEGVCLVEYQGRKGIVSKEGNYIDLSRLNITNVYRFNSGRAQIRRNINGSDFCGYIDYNGNLVIDVIYDDYRSTSFQNGVAKVERFECNNGSKFCKKVVSAYIDINGKILCNYEVKDLKF